MADLNEVNLLGRATRDAELKATPTGQHVATVSVATGDNYTTKDGKKVEDTEFSNIVFWGKLAEIAGGYLTKWKRVYIKGKLKTRTWESDDGKKNYRTEIIAKEMILLDGGEKKTAKDGIESDEEFKKRVKDEEISVEDIPF